MSVIALQYVKLGQLQSLIFSATLLNSEANSQAKSSSEEKGGNPGSNSFLSFFFFFNPIYVTRRNTLAANFWSVEKAAEFKSCLCALSCHTKLIQQKRSFDN